MTYENAAAAAAVEFLLRTVAFAVGFVALVLLQGVQPSRVKTNSLAPVTWNSTNPIFKSSMKDHVIEVKLFDDIDFVCPYSDILEDSREWREYFTIYMVSRKEYEECSIHPRSAATPILNCTNPHQRKRFTILFEPFQSIPNAHEYQEGGSYFYITTSTGAWDGLDNRNHGACRQQNMKLTIRVCCRPTETQETSANNSNSISSILLTSDVTKQTTFRSSLRTDDRRLPSSPTSVIERRARTRTTAASPKSRQKLTTYNAIEGRRLLSDRRTSPNDAVVQRNHGRDTQTEASIVRTPPKAETAKPDRLSYVSGHSGSTGNSTQKFSTIFLVIFLMSIRLSLFS